jgi:hypothetical protein
VLFAADAFELRTAAGGFVEFDLHTVTSDGVTWVYLAFAPLADGAYSLTIHADNVWDRFGRSLDGDDDGTSGGDLAVPFHALAGDLDGDRDVDLDDVALFDEGAAQGLWSLDLDGDGDADSDDRDLLLGRVGMSL